MKQHQAIQMLDIPNRFHSTGQLWVDLGCGTGTFTLALAHHLGAKNRIIAIDQNHSSLNQIPDQSNSISIEKREDNFLEFDFPSNSLNGILMANSLHYVQHQEAFIERVKKFLKPNGCFLIVEYDTNRSNPWIPYPIPFYRLNTLFSKTGFASVKKIKERASLYNRSSLYSAIIEK